jgi:3-oxoacyl-[acyl-carrier protein] reductase
MDLGLKGKKAVITGASKGIGRCTALLLAAEGADVAICARGADALEATRSEVAKAGGKVYAAACDVADALALSAFMNAAHAALGGVDILINNPSGFGMSDDEAGWKVSIDVDLMATVRATQAVLPWMSAAGGGAIVHISSISGLEAGSPAPYAAVKAALFNYTKTIAAQVAAQNIRVNCVAPGSIFIDGGFWDMVKQHNREMFDGVVSTIPAGRMGRAEDVADTIVYLASQRAAWVSGATLVVDGVQHKGIY